MVARILYVSLMGTPAAVRPDLYAGTRDGATDDRWTLARLREAGLESRVSLDFVDVSKGDRLPAPDLARDGTYAAVLVGGSYHNVNEGHAWQHDAMRWLQAWRRTGRPFLGLCGGHQMAAVLLGGCVERLADGPLAGTEPIELTETGRAHHLFEGLDRPTVHLAHYDHVTRLPDNATLLATRRGVVMAMDLGGDWIGVQFHPEASAETMEVGWDADLPPDRYHYHDTPDGARIIANFLRGTGLV